LRPDCHGASPIDVRDPESGWSYLCFFGFPEFQSEFFDTYKQYFLGTLPIMRSLGDKILRQAIPDASVQADVHALAVLAFATHLEVVLLAGNGFGFGAAKGARSILESLFIIEYLIKHPQKAESHRARGDQKMWVVFEEAAQQGFDLGRFQLNVNELRKRHKSEKWHIDQIARDIGRSSEYTIYRVLSELAHSGPLGISFRASEVPGNEGPVVALGRSHEFCDLSLYLAHKFLIMILEAVNDLFDLGYAERLAAGLANLEKAWQRPQ
jgi:hypothetical protein